MSLLHKVISYTAAIFLLGGCMKYIPPEEERFDFGPGSGMADGVFIVHEGRFTYSEASLSYYVPETGQLENNIFERANTIPLGDVAQSMAIRGGRGFITVNNSNIMFAVDIDTFRVNGALVDLPSPRYIHFVSDDKAYVTSLGIPKITIFNPREMRITGHIPTGNHKSTEQMAQYGKYLFVTCWSYDNTILIIDTETDEITGSLTTRIQPRWIVLDRNEKLWVLTDGGYNTSAHGYEPPALYRIDPASRTIEREFTFFLGDSPRGLALSDDGGTLYFLNKHLYRMPVTDDALPQQYLIYGDGMLYYSLGIAPGIEEIYLADAIDYSQRGVVYRFTKDGTPVDTLRTGIIPSGFYFK